MDKEYKDIVRSLPHSMVVTVDESVMPSLEAAVKYIDGMDFDLIRTKLMLGDPLLCRTWSSLEVEIAVQYYRNFLFLNKKYGAQYPVLPPSLEVDEVWHHHIMDTRQYETDCNRIFGYYFHHYPYFGTRSIEDERNLHIAFEVMQELHELEFGQKMISVWGV